jgi:peptide/nickel transport system ATP-binding protein
VVHDVSFELLRGECLAVVGESGSGKTTVSRCIGGLHKEWVGSVKLGWAVLARDARARALQQRLGIQYVFQNPYGSLNPRRTVGATVRRPLVLAGVDDSTADRIVAETLERVALTASYANRYPDQLSGGERQRVAIARALAHRPDVLVCDEITSALDVVVQAAIVELLAALRRDLGLSMLFITHNLPLVRSIADSVVVMSEGRIVERGPAARVIDDPREEYTRRLISDTPSIVRALA